MPQPATTSPARLVRPLGEAPRNRAGRSNRRPVSAPNHGGHSGRDGQGQRPPRTPGSALGGDRPGNPRPTLIISRRADRRNQRVRRAAATGDAGSATVELTLITPLLVMVLLLVVLCGRLVAAQIDVDAAASSGARSGSIARTEAAARTNAERTARDILAARGIACRDATVTVDTGGLRPASAVTVTVACVVPLADLLLLGVPGSRTVSATATSPIDQWRGKALGFRQHHRRSSSSSMR
ncbi:MAG: pilus assembly protein [Micromonosporaceae bacterium]|nr:pilus assembly protein [Micromonosporaceae bacterium]